MAGKTLQLDIKIDGKLDPSVTAAFTKLSAMASKTATQMQQAKVTQSINAMAQNSQKIMAIFAKGALIAGAAIGTIGAKGVMLASNLQEVQNVVDVTFGKNAEQVSAWSKTLLDSYGLSELSAKKYASTIGAMLKSSGLADGQVVNMSKDLTKLSADFASFYNLDSEEAFNKIRAGISGETEPLKQLGINMSVANLEAYALSKGIKKSYQDMTQAEQATLRYSYLLGVSKDAQGDFTRTQKGFANQMRLAKERTDQLMLSIGEKLLPQLTPLLIKFNEFISTIKPETLEQIGKGISDIASGGLQTMTDIFTTLSPIVMGVFNFMKDNSELVMAAVLGIVSSMIALKIASLGLKIVPVIIELIALATGKLTFAQLSLNAAFLANPMTWIVLGIVAAIGILVFSIYLLWKHWDTVTKFLGDAWNGFIELLKSAGQGIVGFFKAFGRDIFIGLTLPFTPFILAFNAMIAGLNNIPGINIPLIPSIMEKIPKFANGGTINSATMLLAGEAGTETIVPHNNKPRSRALAMAAAQGAGLSIGGNTYVYSPQIFGGSSDVRQAIKDGFEDFKAFMERYERESERVSYGI